MTAYKMTKSELTDRAKNLGYCVKIQDGEIEAYPKGMRGNASIFETDSDDGSGRIAIVETIKADRSARFVARLSYLPIDAETKKALADWHEYHGEKWIENLIYQGWLNGRYDGDSTHHYSGALQRLRNTNWHEILTILEPAKMR